MYFTVTRNAISIPPWTNPINDIMDVQRATIETLVEAMGEEAGLSFAYQSILEINILMKTLKLPMID